METLMPPMAPERLEAEIRQLDVQTSVIRQIADEVAAGNHESPEEAAQALQTLTQQAVAQPAPAEPDPELAPAPAPEPDDEGPEE